MEHGDSAASGFELVLLEVSGFGDDLGDGLGLDAGAVIEGNGFEVVLVATEPPVAEVILIEVSAGGPSFRMGSRALLMWPPGACMKSRSWLCRRSGSIVWLRRR